MSGCNRQAAIGQYGAPLQYRHGHAGHQHPTGIARTTVTRSNNTAVIITGNTNGNGIPHHRYTNNSHHQIVPRRQRGHTIVARQE